MSSVAGLLLEPEASAPAQASPDDRILEATLRCISRWGIAKTTLDDVARQAMCSRATVYRAFPGGKDALLRELGRSEVRRVAAAIGAAMDGASGLGDGLASAVAVAATEIAGHPALHFLLLHEPEAVVPWLAFQGGEELLEFAADFAAPHLGRWLPPAEARRAAEWAARIVLSFCFCPSPGVDLADRDSALCVVTTFMIPGLRPGR